MISLPDYADILRYGFYSVNDHFRNYTSSFRRKELKKKAGAEYFSSINKLLVKLSRNVTEFCLFCLVFRFFFFLEIFAF